jgi:transposase InsO family protein
LNAEIDGAEEVPSLSQHFERQQSRLPVQWIEHVVRFPLLEPQRDEIAPLGVKFQDVVPSIQLEEADGCDAVSSYQEDRVDSHKNAPMTPEGRMRMVQAVLGGEPISVVATCSRVDRKSVRKWVLRYQAEGEPGLVDRSSRPHRMPHAIAKGTAQRIVTLRRRRWTMGHIAAQLHVSRATVSRVLARAGLSRLAALDPAPLPRRYEWARPGDVVHIDTKKLARIEQVGHRITGDHSRKVEGAGWEYAFVGVDDHSRTSFGEMLNDERKREAATFLEHAVSYYRHLGVHVRRVMTDNAKIFHSKLFQGTCRRLNIRHLFTKPYTPRTNGKAERFIQTAMRECFYGRSFRHSRQRTAYFADWLHSLQLAPTAYQLGRPTTHPPCPVARG